MPAVTFVGISGHVAGIPPVTFTGMSVTIPESPVTLDQNTQTKGDEMVQGRCDLDFCAVYKRTTFNFDLHRHPECYGLIVEKKGETLAADGSAWRG